MQQVGVECHLTSSVSSHLWDPEVHPSCFKNSSKSVVLFRQQDQNLYLKQDTNMSLLILSLVIRETQWRWTLDRTVPTRVASWPNKLMGNDDGEVHVYWPIAIAVITDVSGLTCKWGERVNLVLFAVWHANEVKGSIWHCIGPLASFVGSNTSRCSGKWARTKTGLERAAVIEPNLFAYFLKTK